MFLCSFERDDNMKNYIVYMHINKYNSKRYIGITCQNPNERWRKGKGYEKSKLFYNAILKYGWNNFEHIILFINLTKEEAEQKEIELIARYKSNDEKYGYNIQNGGNHNGKHSEKTKEKIRMAKIGKNNPNYGKETWNKGKKTGPLSEETRIKLSIIRSKQVICVETSIIYVGTRDAERKTGISHSNISRCCKDTQKTARGYHWRYYNE